MTTTSEQAELACAKCGALLVADQRYCLSCGHPVSPVRLSFLDVLHSGHPHETPASTSGWLPAERPEIVPVGYPQQGIAGWLRRNSGLTSLLTVLLMCLIVGLLVGHWVSQGYKPAGPQIVKVEGLSGLGGAATAGSTTPTAPAQTTTTSSANATAKEEAEAAKQAAKETKAEKAPPPPPVKVQQNKLEKLSKSSGKKHQEEINALGSQPIETG